jgi:hypothetical protein
VVRGHGGPKLQKPTSKSSSSRQLCLGHVGMQLSTVLKVGTDRRNRPPRPACRLYGLNTPLHSQSLQHRFLINKSKTVVG